MEHESSTTEGQKQLREMFNKHEVSVAYIKSSVLIILTS